MSDIKLTASMRTNLLSLQNTQSLMDMTQERLSTGLKVNSAIDNPSSYYASQSLTNRANDLTSLLDSMGQGIQTIKAANEGIESITAFAEQAKALVNTALDTKDADSILAASKQFDEVLKQIETMAKDSSYKGVNLLADDDLTVKFNEKAKDRSLLVVEGKDVVAEMAVDASEDKWVKEVTVAAPAAEFTGGASITKGDVFKVTAADGSIKLYEAKNDITYTAVETPSATATNWEEVADGSAGVFADVSPETVKAGDIYTAADGKHYKAKIDMGTIEIDATNFSEVTDETKIKAYTSTNPDEQKYFEYDTEAMNTSLTQIEDAITRLRDIASEFGNNYSIVQNREEFTNNIINVLEEGSDKLTLADMNEESANMLALQTRQQLAVNSLSLASQAAQSVLKLFG